MNIKYVDLQKFNLKKGAFGWFNYKTSVEGSDDGALESLFNIFV